MICKGIYLERGDLVLYWSLVRPKSALLPTWTEAVGKVKVARSSYSHNTILETKQIEQRIDDLSV
jgi:hypothetical protein